MVKFKNCIFTAFVLMSIIVAAIIFLLSHQDGTESSSTSTGVTEIIVNTVVDLVDDITEANTEQIVEEIHGFIRILGHFFGFAALSFFVSGAVLSSKLSYKRTLKFGLSLIITLTYAILDEIHQYFIPGRAFQVFDITIDLLGGILGAVILYRCFRIYKKIICKKRQKNAKAY